ncbi:hypothetical protein HK101_006298, partial [Irineochytrium annulatum]
MDSFMDGGDGKPGNGKESGKSTVKPTSKNRATPSTHVTSLDMMVGDIDAAIAIASAAKSSAEADEAMLDALNRHQSMAADDFYANMLSTPSSSPAKSKSEESAAKGSAQTKKFTTSRGVRKAPETSIVVVETSPPSTLQRRGGRQNEEEETAMERRRPSQASNDIAPSAEADRSPLSPRSPRSAGRRHHDDLPAFVPQQDASPGYISLSRNRRAPRELPTPPRSNIDEGMAYPDSSAYKDKDDSFSPPSRSLSRGRPAPKAADDFASPTRSMSLGRKNNNADQPFVTDEPFNPPSRLLSHGRNAPVEKVRQQDAEDNFTAPSRSLSRNQRSAGAALEQLETGLPNQTPASFAAEEPFCAPSRSLSRGKKPMADANTTFVTDEPFTPPSRMMSLARGKKAAEPAGQAPSAVAVIRESDSRGKLKPGSGYIPPAPFIKPTKLDGAVPASSASSQNLQYGSISRNGRPSKTTDPTYPQLEAEFEPPVRSLSRRPKQPEAIAEIYGSSPDSNPTGNPYLDEINYPEAPKDEGFTAPVRSLSRKPKNPTAPSPSPLSNSNANDADGEDVNAAQKRPVSFVAPARTLSVRKKKNDAKEPTTAVVPDSTDGFVPPARSLSRKVRSPEPSQPSSLVSAPSEGFTPPSRTLSKRNAPSKGSRKDQLQKESMPSSPLSHTSPSPLSVTETVPSMKRSKTTPPPASSTTSPPDGKIMTGSGHLRLDHDLADLAALMSAFSLPSDDAAALTPRGARSLGNRPPPPDYPTPPSPGAGPMFGSISRRGRGGGAPSSALLDEPLSVDDVLQYAAGVSGDAAPLSSSPPSSRRPPPSSAPRAVARDWFADDNNRGSDGSNGSISGVVGSRGTAASNVVDAVATMPRGSVSGSSVTGSTHGGNDWPNGGKRISGGDGVGRKKSTM